MRFGVSILSAAGVLLACCYPAYCQNQSANGDGQDSSQSGQAPVARLGGGGFQSLSPEQKVAVIKRFRQNRAARQQGGAATSAGNSSSVASNADLSFSKDIAYGPAPLQRLDVYAPKSAKGPLPMLMFVHGGGWHRGDKGQGDRSTKGASYVANNIIFVSINYRLAPDVMHPKQVQDVAAAFAWVKEHASEYGGDPNRIFLMGHSAGAQLVDLLGTNDRFLKERGLALKDISGVISLDTASLNLEERTADQAPETGLVGPMIDAAFGKDPNVLKDGSPTLCIHPGKSYPPFLMFCGSARLNCVAQHKEFAEAMKRAGGSAVVKPVPLSHGDINRASGEPDSDIFKQCVALIKR